MSKSSGVLKTWTLKTSKNNETEKTHDKKKIVGVKTYGLFIIVTHMAKDELILFP